MSGLLNIIKISPNGTIFRNNTKNDCSKTPKTLNRGTSVAGSLTGLSSHLMHNIQAANYDINLSQ